MSGRNWNALGLGWEVSAVKRQHGDHATDRVTLGDAQLPVIVDLDAFRANVPQADDILKGIWNGTSARVQAQDVSRRALEAGQKDPEAIREAVYNRLLGVRAAPTATKSYPLPNGEKYIGTDLTAYKQAVMVAAYDVAVAAGATPELANTMAKLQADNARF